MFSITHKKQIKRATCIRKILSTLGKWIITIIKQLNVQRQQVLDETGTLTPPRIGSLLIMSISGGVTRGVPVVIMSPSIGAPYTLTGSHRLVKETLF